MIIAVEGADKAGKHTQVVKTVNYMQEHGIPTETIDFPQYDTPIGKEIQKVLNGEIVLSAEESMELFAKNREEQMPQINEWIQAGLDVTVEEMKKEDAVKSGAECMFIEKYPDVVTVYTIGNVSKELCGGPHVKNTSELGKFKIKKEEASSAGVRRIKAILEK